MTETLSRLTIRPYRRSDDPAVRELIDADRLPGQPPCPPDRLASALAGRAPVDLGWGDIEPPQTRVLTGPQDRPLGIISYAAWDETALVLWLHGRENPTCVQALLAHALGELACCPSVQACFCAAPHTPGLPGLPRAHRRVTHAALIQAGFTARRQGVYLHRALPAPSLPTKLVADVYPYELLPDGWRLMIRENQMPIAEALVSLDPGGVATLWWIETLPTHRGRGLGRQLLGQALGLLAEQGAAEVVGVVEDSAPGTDEPQAALQLFRAFGFTPVDRLWTYHRRHRRPDGM